MLPLPPSGDIRWLKVACIAKGVGATLAAAAIGGPVAGIAVGSVAVAAYKTADHFSKKAEAEAKKNSS